MARLSQPYQLLVADDDPRFRATLRSIFEPHFSLYEAASGEEAIEISVSQRVDIVLLDMHMSTLTGLETIRVLKSINALVPCILITADATDEVRRLATDVHAYSVLAKPVSKSELVTTVSTALEYVYEDPDVQSLLPDTPW